MLTNEEASFGIIELLINKGANTTLHEGVKNFKNAELVQIIEERMIIRRKTKYNQAYRGLAAAGIHENIIGKNITGLLEGPVAPGQGRPEYPARPGFRKTRKSNKKSSKTRRLVKY
jgi:hypothetical protein